MIQIIPKPEEIIAEAIDKKQHLSLAQCGTSWNLFKAKFCDVCDQEIKITDIHKTFGNKRLGELPSGITISFRRGSRKMVFLSEYCHDDLIEFPLKLVSMSRRLFNRERPLYPIKVKFWKSKRDYNGRLENISCGGMTVKTTDHNEFPSSSYTCTIETTPRITLSAILKTSEQVDNGFNLGFQFTGLDVNPQRYYKTLRRAISGIRRHNRRTPAARR